MPETAIDELEFFRQGDLDAFEVLFRRRQRAVYGWVFAILRNAADAEEVTAESFWRIYQARAQFDPARSFEAWARRIAANAALDRLRQRRPESELKAEVAAPPADDPALAAEIRLKTASAFGRLPPRLRIAATLAVVEERPHKEIAAALGISVTAVKVRVFRALRILRRDLERQGITP